MKSFLSVAVVAALTLASAALFAEEPQALATDRYVHGVITSVEAGAMTIASSSRAVTGRIDPARTKVTINGHAARVQDLKVTDHVKAELCLDDVWLLVDEH